jgi:hypothetical protein
MADRLWPIRSSQIVAPALKDSPTISALFFQSAAVSCAEQFIEMQDKGGLRVGGVCL